MHSLLWLPLYCLQEEASPSLAGRVCLIFLFTLSLNILFIFHTVCIRLLSCAGSIVLLFAPVEVIKSCSEIQDVLVSTDSGVVISSKQSSVLFPTKSRAPQLFTKPATVVVVSSDR